MGAGVVLTAVLVMTIKFSVRRSRPEGEWGRIYRSTDPHSFPSGHAARGMLLAVVALGLGPIWLGLLLLLWAPLMSLARVAMGVHYPSDVIAGWLIGAVMQLKPDQVQGGTFTITNHGVSGSLFATPIINQPQCAILGVGKIQKRVVVVSDLSGGDVIAIRPMVYLGLTFDHRILDGALADAFLGNVVDVLQKWS